VFQLLRTVIVLYQNRKQDEQTRICHKESECGPLQYKENLPLPIELVHIKLSYQRMDKQHLEHKVVQGEPYKCYAGRVKYYESDRADVLKI
jgi:hypothetical protein